MKKLKQMYRCIEELKYGNGKTTGCPTKTFGHDRQCGFTLVELVIVIAIVIILSVISVPIYRGYVDKAKYAEGYALLGAILSAQKAYYTEYGSYLWCTKGSATSDSGGCTCNDEVLGIDARGNKYFTYFKISQGVTGVAGLDHAVVAFVKIPENLSGSDNRYLRLYSNNTISRGIFSEVDGTNSETGD